MCSRLYFKSMRENWIIQYKQHRDNWLPIIYQRFKDLNGKNETIKLLKKKKQLGTCLVAKTLHLQCRGSLTLGDHMDCSMPGFPVLHLLELAQTHVH